MAHAWNRQRLLLVRTSADGISCGEEWHLAWEHIREAELREVPSPAGSQTCLLLSADMTRVGKAFKDAARASRTLRLKLPPGRDLMVLPGAEDDLRPLAAEINAHRNP